jgi:signal transduction histidine kinase
MHSLLSRLNAGLVVSLVVLFALQWALVSFSIDYLVGSYVAARLEDDTEGLLSALSVTPQGQGRLDPARINPVFLRPFSGHYYDIAVAGSNQSPFSLHSRSLWDEDLPVVRLAGGQTQLSRVAGPQGQRLLLRVSGFEKQGHAVTIAVAEDLSPLRARMRRFQWGYAAVSLFMLLALFALQRWIVTAGLRPLKQVQEDMARLERGEVRRMREDVPTEIAPLVRELNRLLLAITRRMERSRHALGNLAHALKTPLTLLTRLADDPALRANGALRDRLIEHTATLDRLIERELKRARLAGGVTPGRQVVLEDEVHHLIVALQGIHRDKGLDIRTHIPPAAQFSGDREDFLELMGNVLDNACKWARRQVALTVEDGPGLRFRVEDDGPGCPPAFLDELTRRGVRVDESTAGHGLGLAIVRDIVESYGGTIGFDRSATLGGLQASVRLP